MFSILAWNIQQGGGSRIREIAQALISKNPLVIVLSEYRNNEKGSFLRNQLLLSGYRFQFVTNAPKQENSVLIASKYPCNSVLHPKADETFAANILEVQFDAFNLFGVYLPHKKKHELLSYMQDLLQQTEKPYILTGDFNTGINGVDQEGKSFWYQPEMLAFDELNYIDAYRLKHGDKKDYSWYSHGGVGYRYDHFYIHQSLSSLVSTCDYIHAWREQKLADHSPMILELG